MDTKKLRQVSLRSAGRRRKRLSWVAACCLGTLMIGPSLLAAQASREMDARSLLQKVREALLNRPPLAFDAETVMLPSDGVGVPGGFRGYRYVESFRQEADKVDIVLLRIDKQDDGSEREEWDHRSVWTGKFYVHRQRVVRPGARSNADFSDNREKQHQIRSVRTSQSAFIDGYLPGGDKHYSSYMLDAKTLRLHPAPTEIDGHACSVVEARDEQRTYKVWIDTAHGYNFRRLKFTRQKEGVDFRYQVTGVTFARVEGVWLPVAGAAHELGRYAAGTDDFRYETVRRNVRFRPDFEAMGAFKMDLKDGTRLTNFEDRTTSYVWYHGRPGKVEEIHDAVLGSKAPRLAIEKWYSGVPEDPSFGGKFVLLDFFGVWCPPCMAKIPFLKSLHEEYAGRGLTIVGIHTQQAKEKIPEFITRDEIEYAIAVDAEGQTAKAFNVFFYPTVVLLDREGIIRAINPTDEELSDLLNSLLEKTN